MRRALPGILLLASALLAGGCRPAQAEIDARCERMKDAGEETPLEEMPDDDQGIIYF